MQRLRQGKRGIGSADWSIDKTCRDKTYRDKMYQDKTDRPNTCRQQNISATNALRQTNWQPKRIGTKLSGQNVSGDIMYRRIKSISREFTYVPPRSVVSHQHIGRNPSPENVCH